MHLENIMKNILFLCEFKKKSTTSENNKHEQTLVDYDTCKFSSTETVIFLLKFHGVIFQFMIHFSDVTGLVSQCLNVIANKFLRPLTLKIPISSYDKFILCSSRIKPLNINLTDILYLDYNHSN